MRRIWPALLALLWLALLPGAVRAAELLPLPALTARVTDLTATLDATQRGQLEAQLAAIEHSGRAQIAVLLLPTTQPETVEQFGIRLAEAWKIGRKDADDGVIIVVAKDDRRMRIEVGYGLEGAVPDAIASRIVNERLAPALRKGDFFGGLQAAVAELDRTLSGDAAAVPALQPGAAVGMGAEDSDLLPWLMGAAAVGSVLRSMFGLLGSLAAAVVAGWLGFAIFGSWLAAVLAAAIIFGLSFFNLHSRGGGFSSGGGGFSGGGGGFSGGGGGFGGGGASGRW